MATADFPHDVVASSLSPQTGAALQTRLKQLAARRNAQRRWHCMMRALCPGVALSAALMLAHRFYLLDLPVWAIPSLLGASASVGVFDGMRHRADAFDAALDADRVLNLRERLSSALAFVAPEERKAAALTESTPMVPALVEDAAARAVELDPKLVYPVRLGRAARVLGVATLALAAFMLMPDNDYFRAPEARALAATQKKEGRELEVLAKQVRERKAVQKDEESQQMTKKLESLGRKMQRGRMGKKETLLALGEMRQELEKKQNLRSQNNGMQNLQKIEEQLQQEEMQSAEGRKMQDELRNKDVEKAADQLEKLADKLEKGDMTPQEKEQAANDLEKTAKALRENGQEDAAKQMEDAAKQLREQNKSGAQQNQNGQNGKDGQQKNQQNQNGQQGQKNQSGQQNQSGQKGQNGQQNQGGQQGQKNQSGQQGQQNSQNQQGKNGQQSGQQGGQQNGGQQQGKQGGQQQQGGGSQSQGGKQGNSSSQGGSDALRNLAKGMRNNGGGNSGAMRDMLNKIREAEKNSGQSGQQGQQGQKPGQGGQGQGQGDKPGQGMQGKLMPSDPKGTVDGGQGLGPRNNATNVGKTPGNGKVPKPLGKVGGKDKRRWQDIWSDRLPQTQKKISRIQGKIGDSGEMDQLPTRSDAKGGAVNTPYYDVYESYKRDAEDAITREAVPPAYKQPVKDYFDSLRPEKDSGR